MNDAQQDAGAKGRYDTGTCFICTTPEVPQAPLVTGQWHGQRIWLCPRDRQAVDERMRVDGISEDQALDRITKSVMTALFPDWEFLEDSEGQDLGLVRAPGRDLGDVEDVLGDGVLRCGFCAEPDSEHNPLIEAMWHQEPIKVCAWDLALAQELTRAQGLSDDEAMDQVNTAMLDQLFGPRYDPFADQRPEEG